MKIISFTHHNTECYYPNPKYFLFMLGFEFKLLIYCNCLQNYGHLEFKDYVLKTVCKNKNIGNIDRSLSLEKAVKENEVSSLINSPFNEICYIYSNNAGKTYCYYRETTYQDYLINALEFGSRLDEAIKTIKALELDCEIQNRLIEEAGDLVFENDMKLFKRLKETTIIKFTDKLTKHNLKQIL